MRKTLMYLVVTLFVWVSSAKGESSIFWAQFESLDRGIRVVSVSRVGFAERLGLRAEDTILTFGDSAVNSEDELEAALEANRQLAIKLKLQRRRNKNKAYLPVPLALTLERNGRPLRISFAAYWPSGGEYLDVGKFVRLHPRGTHSYTIKFREVPILLRLKVNFVRR